MRDLPSMAENAFRVWAESQGWKVAKRGWPDFMCWGPEGALMAVEVKGPTDQLRHDQTTMLKALNRCGVPTFTWTMETGLRLYPTVSRRSEPGMALRLLELEELLRKVTAERDEARTWLSDLHPGQTVAWEDVKQAWANPMKKRKSPEQRVVEKLKKQRRLLEKKYRSI